MIQAKFNKLRNQQKVVQKQLKKLGYNKKKSNPKSKEAAEQIRKLLGESKQLKTELRSLQQKLKKKGGGKRYTGPVAMGIRDRATCADCRINLRGEAKKLGEAAPRGFLSVIDSDPPKFDKQQSGRLELAKWIADADNPLTARVMVNRVWCHLFGEGIVRTVDNFGINGERPSHPELLDYLAIQFVKDGWSVKKLIRRIMLSRTYQLSSENNAANMNTDPDNRFVWRMSTRRVDAESLRDSILAVSGKLDLTPYKGSVVSNYGDALIQDKLTTEQFDVENNHRSVYLPIVRNGVPEVLRLFDFADPSLVVGKRNVTFVPSQELFLMNSKFVAQQAQAFAQRLLASEKLSDTERVQQAYQLAFCRPATNAEVQRVLQYIEGMETEDNNVQERQRAWSGFCQALFVATEFRFIE